MKNLILAVFLVGFANADAGIKTQIVLSKLPTIDSN